MSLLAAVPKVAAGALRRAAYLLLSLLAWLRCAWVELSAAAAEGATQLAVAAPPARPLRGLLFSLTAAEHVGSRPRPPRSVAVVVAEPLLGGQSAPAAATAAALAALVAWALQQRLAHLFIYDPAGELQQQRRPLELLLLQHQLLDAARVQCGWQDAGTTAEDPPLPLVGAAAGEERCGGEQPTAVLQVTLLSAADAQWPLLAAAEGAIPSPALQSNGDASPTSSSGRAAALEAAIAAPQQLRGRLQAAAGPLAGVEPDLLLVTGPALTLAGYPPWAARVSEIYGVGPLAALSSPAGAAQLDAALRRYSHTKQRFGK